MSDDHIDPFSQVPNPNLDPGTIRQFAYEMARRLITTERNRRARLREERLRGPATKPDPPEGSIESAIQDELEGLTDENAHEVRARLKDLHRSQDEAPESERAMRGDSDNWIETVGRLGTAAWYQALKQDEHVARQWESAYWSQIPPVVRETVERDGSIQKDRHIGHVGIQMLMCAAMADPKAQDLYVRIRRIVARSSARERNRNE